MHACKLSLCNAYVELCYLVGIFDKCLTWGIHPQVSQFIFLVSSLAMFVQVVIVIDVISYKTLQVLHIHCYVCSGVLTAGTYYLNSTRSYFYGNVHIFNVSNIADTPSILSYQMWHSCLCSKYIQPCSNFNAWYSCQWSIEQELKLRSIALLIYM